MSEKPKCYSSSHMDRGWIVCDNGCYPTACRMPFSIYKASYPEEAAKLGVRDTHVCEHCGHVQKRKWGAHTRSQCSVCHKQFYWEERRKPA